MDDVKDLKDAIIRIESHTIELVKQGAVHNTLLQTHESRSLALQRSQEQLDTRIQPIERHVHLIEATSKIVLAILIGVIVQALVRHFLPK